MGGEALAVEPSHFSTGSDATGESETGVFLNKKRLMRLPCETPVFKEN